MYSKNDYTENDFTENEINAIAEFYLQFRCIKTNIEVGLEFFDALTTDEWITDHQNALVREKKEYETLCAKLSEFPENVQNYPLLNKMRRTIDDQVQLIHS